MDFNIKLKSGLVLRGIIQSPGENARAVVVMVHGLGEHIQRYGYWSELFRNEGIAFTGVDLPGHGRSEGRKGHVSSYEVINEMITIMLDSCRKHFRVFLFIFMVTAWEEELFLTTFCAFIQR